MEATQPLLAEQAATGGPLVVPVPIDAAMQVGTLDVSAGHAQALAVFEPLRANLKPKHAIDFFSNINRKKPANQQQIEAICTLCAATVRSTGSSSNYESMAKLKITAPARPALVPLAAPLETDDELLDSTGRPLMLM